MSGIKTIIRLAIVDERGRKRKNRTFSAFLTLVITFFLLLHSGLESLVNNIQDTINKPYGRTLLTTVTGTDYEEDVKRLKEQLKEIDGVGQVVWNGSIFASWLNAESVRSNAAEVTFFPALEVLEEYLVDGTCELSEGQILVPKYLFQIGAYNEYNYVDGKELIGNTLEFQMEHRHTGEVVEYEFEVVGTYNNVRSGTGGNAFCINDIDMLKLHQSVSCGSADELVQQLLEQGFTMEEIGVVEDQYSVGIYVLPGYDMTEVMKNIEMKTGQILFPFLQYDQTMVNFYTFIIKVCDIIMGMLAVTAFVAFVTLVVQELRERKGEMAMRYAIGYSKAIQYAAFLCEKVILFGWVILTGLIITGVGMAATNYVVQSILPFYFRSYRFAYDVNAIGVVMVAVMLGLGIAAIISLFQISKISIAQTLKQEGTR